MHGGQALVAPPRGPQSDAASKRGCWQQRAKFTQSYQEFQSAVDALWSTAQGRDVAAIRERHRAAAKTCGNCHDSFRERMD